MSDVIELESVPMELLATREGRLVARHIFARNFAKLMFDDGTKEWVMLKPVEDAKS